MIKYSLTFVFFLLSSTIVAQQDPVLMRINGKEVLRSEFEYVYNKKKPVGGEQKLLKDCANQFADFKLKVAAAEAAGMDTTRTFQNQLDECRRQLVRAYLTDEEATERAAHQYYNKMKDSHRSGQIRVSHIFKHLPQNISGSALRAVELKMDSIYEALRQEGERADFEAYVKRFSDEKTVFWISWLQMPTEFEDVVFGMPKGEISRPFLSPQGIHIVKVIERKEILPFEEAKREIIRNQTRTHGIDKGTEASVEKLKKEYHFALDKTAVNELLAKGETSRTLFTLADKAYTGQNFARFAAAHPEGVKRQLDAFIMKSVLDYENAHLEQKYPEFRLVMQECRDSILLHAISNGEVWKQNKLDETALKAYFEEHRSDYNWEESRYKGIVLHCVSKRVAKDVRKLLKQLPESEWQNAIRLTFNAGSTTQVQAEQGLFAPGDNMYIDEFVFKGQKISPILSFPFTVIVGKKLKGPDDPQMVRQQLLDNYQKHLEQRWTTKLRTAGKVEINQEVLKTVNNH